MPKFLCKSRPYRQAGEKLISLQDQESFKRACYDKAVQANTLCMPEQYLFSAAAKTNLPFLSKLNWQNDLY